MTSTSTTRTVAPATSQNLSDHKGRGFQRPSTLLSRNLPQAYEQFPRTATTVKRCRTGATAYLFGMGQLLRLNTDTRLTFGQAAGGGPSEDNVTGFLVRSCATKWSKNSVLAVDAGSHLASICRILEADFPKTSHASTEFQAYRRQSWNGTLFQTAMGITSPSDDASDCSSRPDTPEPHITVLTSGPFAGLRFPHDSARANAAHVVRECVSTYLITHPHLDHLSGFIINTAAFHNTSRPKKLAGLPSTVNAIKLHLFNDIIWPNLTDEDGGVGLVSFQRLADGGNIAVGEGFGRGYIEVCDGLCVRAMKISHGHCTKGPTSLYHRGSDVGLSEATTVKSEDKPSTFSKSATRSSSISHQLMPGTPNLNTLGAQPASGLGDLMYREVVVDSTAYFIRDDATSREVLIFGDVEPDALSLNPRTAQVWAEAAPRIAGGLLRAIVIECSYDDSQADAVLFGHLAPRHLVKELESLASMVTQRRSEDLVRRGNNRRKTVDFVATPSSTKSGLTAMPSAAASETSPSKSRRKRKRSDIVDIHSLVADGEDDDTATPGSLGTPAQPLAPPAAAPLVGLTVIVMHVKDTLRDGPLVGERIMRQLREHDARLKEVDGLGLGCDFVISTAGASYWV